jgi:serine/threonine protein kinase
MHSINLAHLDMKLENVVLVNGRAKIIDFAGIRDFNEKNKSITMSTMVFLPPGNVYILMLTIPEALRDGTQSYANDVWAVGLMILELLCGERPWASGDKDALLQNVESDMLLKAVPENTPSAITHIIMSCLQV